MPFLHDLLDLSTWLLEATAPELEARCAAVARRLVDGRVRAVGLAPADDDVAVPPAALLLGRALGLASAGRVAVIDAIGTWASSTSRSRRGVATTWLLDDLAVLSPPPAAPGGGLAQLQALVEEQGAAFDRLVVDLTGLDHAGEQLGACALLDAVVVVARSGRTRERDLWRWTTALPPPGPLGVLLTGTL